MVVLFLGDIVGDAGCEYVRARLPQLKKKYKADIVVANGENSAEGNGILPSSADFLWTSGVDVITLGNHGLRRREIYDTLEQQNGLIRPVNYHPDSPGEGSYLYKHFSKELCVINLQGCVYMQSYENPFTAIDRVLEQVETKNILVDFHCEATSEKLAMGHYLDGRVSAVVGTHTHVPTADARVLPKGTGYITDAGMCGGLNSILGVQADDAIYRQRTNLPTRFYNDKEDIKISGVVITINDETGKCDNIEQLAFV